MAVGPSARAESRQGDDGSTGQATPVARSAAVRRARRDRLRASWFKLALGTLAAVLTWPMPARLKHAYFDYSWIYGLQEAAHLGLRFGPGVVWTYGPLGYLGVAAIFIPRYGVPALLAASIAWLVLANLLMVYAVRCIGYLAFVPVTLVLLFLAPLVGLYWLVLVLPLLMPWVVARLLRDRPDWSPPVIVAAAFIVVACFDAKGTAGVAALTVLGLAIVLGGALAGGLRAAARNAAWLLGGVVVAVPTLWIVAGQPLGNLRNWFSGYLQVMNGYSSAMAFTSPTRAWQYPVALLLVGLFVIGIAHTPDASRATRLVLAVVVLLGLYVAFRSSFTRQSGIEFFVALAIAPIGFAPRWPFWRWFALSLAAAVALAVSVDLPVSSIVDVSGNVGGVVDSAKLVVSSGYRSDWIRAQAATFAKEYKFPSQLTARVGNRTVDVLPVDAAVTFVVPSLRWRPLPVFQDYAAYTQELDDRNAAALAGPKRPQDIIRVAPAAIDGRLQRFESPHENLELLCRYRVVLALDSWQLLAGGKDRCGAVTTAAPIAATFGDAVHVPASNGDIVVTRLTGVGSSFGDRLQTDVIRGPRFYVSGDRGTTWYRFVPGTQQSWHVVSWPACATPDLLNLGPAFSTLTMSNRLGRATTGTAYHIQFARIPYAC